VSSVENKKLKICKEVCWEASGKWGAWMIQVYLIFFLSLGDRASLYNLVDKANLVNNLFLVYLTISACFGRLCVHHQ